MPTIEEDKETAFRYYKWEHRKEEYWERVWNEIDKFKCDRTGFPPLEDREYVRSEFNNLHEFDKRIYILSGRRIKKDPEVVTAEQEAAKIAQAAISKPVGTSPTAFLKSVAPGNEATLPPDLLPHSLYTVARNNRMNISIQRTDQGFVVKRFT